jgi:hypothetical protein
MAITKSLAKKLCTKPEFEIVEASLELKKTKMSAVRIKQKITLTRKLRDKYNDLAKSQRSEERGKAEPKRSRPATGNEGSVKKAQLFSETLGRFEQYLSHLEKEDKKEDVKIESNTSTLSGKKATSKSTSKKTGVAKSAESTKEAKKTNKTKTTKPGQPKPAPSSLQRKLEQNDLKKKKAEAKKVNESMDKRSRSAGGRITKFKMTQNRSGVIQSHIKASGKRNQAKRDSK